MKRQIGQGVKRFEEERLPAAFGIRRLDNRGEVSGRDECLIRLEQMLDHRRDVEPVKPFPSLFTETEV